jgi:hypothetical protein
MLQPISQSGMKHDTLSNCAPAQEMQIKHVKLNAEVQFVQETGITR